MVALPKQHNILDFPEPVQQGKSNEWYTPAIYIEAAREVMGGVIDLDPASCEVANRTVKARRYYSKKDNGLAQDWTIDGRPSRVWLNPPYGNTDGKSNMGAFTRRVVASYEDGSIEQAILLVTSKTCASYFQPLWKYIICFPNHDINFDTPIRNKSRFNGKMAHIHGTVFVYLGPNEASFIEHFSPFGRIARAIDTPKPSPVNLTLWNGGEV